MKKIVLLLFIFMITVRIGFTVDFTRGPEVLQPGDLLISGGWSSGYENGSESYIRSNLPAQSYGSFRIGPLYDQTGFSLTADYALPYFGLTVGLETGILTGSKMGYSIGLLPIMGRLGYHPDFGIDNLNIYGLFKIGFALWFIHNDPIVGIGIGLGIGGRYFFFENFGVFAELGYDHFYFNKSGNTITANRLYTIGITYKINNLFNNTE